MRMVLSVALLTFGTSQPVLLQPAFQGGAGCGCSNSQGAVAMTGIRQVRQRIVVAQDGQTFGPYPMSADTEVDVFRNGLLQDDPINYGISSGTVTFTGGGPFVGDVVVIRYWMTTP